MPENETWYESVPDKSLMQGDLIYDCPFVEPPKDASVGDNKSVNIKKYNVIVLSQSCDLMWNKLEYVLVCPFWTLTEIENIITQFKNNKNLKESTRRGYQPPWLLLDKLDDEFLFADFRYVYSVPIETLVTIVNSSGSRQRLRPPYREYLSQEFAKFFMRVGLPKVVPEFSGHSIDYCSKCPVHHAVRE
jgi:hypothetical protein